MLCSTVHYSTVRTVQYISKVLYSTSVQYSTYSTVQYISTVHQFITSVISTVQHASNLSRRCSTACSVVSWPGSGTTGRSSILMAPRILKVGEMASSIVTRQLLLGMISYGFHEIFLQTAKLSFNIYLYM